MPSLRLTKADKTTFFVSPKWIAAVEPFWPEGEVYPHSRVIMSSGNVFECIEHCFEIEKHLAV